MDDQARAARLAAVAALGMLLFGYPVLAIADVDARLLGVPVLWLYLFTAWAAVVALVARLVRDA